MSDRTVLPATTRKKIERTLDKLISLLDSLDPDPDLEPSRLQSIRLRRPGE
jgi:hypothetical protein